MPTEAWRLVTAVLRTWLEREPGRLAERLAATRDWPAVIATADRHLVLAPLAAALAALGQDRRLPGEVGDFLVHVRAANRDRNRRLAAGLDRLVATLGRAGIEPVLLKGAIRLVDDLYPDPGWRMLSDLDLLVPTGRGPAAFEALLADGCQQLRDVPPGHHHLPDLWHAPTGSPVELHEHVVQAGFRPVLEASRLLEHARPAPGLAARLPDPADQLLHLIVHDLLSHRGLSFGWTGLRTLLEGRLLLDRLDPAELDRVLGTLADHGHGRAGRVFLALLDLTLGSAAAKGRVGPLDRLLAARMVVNAASPRVMAANLRLVTLARRLRRLGGGRRAGRAAGALSP